MANMGLGSLVNPGLVFKRKFRWQFEVHNVCGTGQNIPSSFVKTSARPNYTVGETEINYLNGKMWIPGKATLETLAVSYFDVASLQSKAEFTPLWGWLATVYDFTDPVGLKQSSTMKAANNGVGGYAADYGLITEYDGCGDPINSFQYLNVWPSAVNFGEMDFSSEEECTIDITFRYSNFKYNPLSNCVPTVKSYGCAGC